MAAGDKNNICPPVPHGICTSSSFVQEICSLPRAAQLGPGMGACEMRLSQVTNWLLLLHFHCQGQQP